MRFNREIFALMFLLLVFVAGGLLLTGHDDSRSRTVGKELVPDPSVYNDRASGNQACFEWVGRLGYRANVWRRPWSRLAEADAPVLFVIDPASEPGIAALTGPGVDPAGTDTGDDTSLRAGDAAALLAWVRAGHTAVVMASRLPSGHTAGQRGGADTFADALDLVVETASPAGRFEFGPLQPTLDTQGVLSLHSDADARLRRKTADGVAIFGDRAGPFVLSIPVGAGRLVAIADSRFASNANLGRSENAVFLANVLGRAARPGATVLFDEYHHGDVNDAAGVSLWTAIGRPLQLSLIQGLLALVVVGAVVAVRFGTPIPLGRGATRTSAEYVTSLAGLYQRAQASHTALEILYRQFLRDLAARLGLAPDVSLEHLADVAARRGGIAPDTLRRLLATCEQRMDEGQVTEPELLDLARRMERIRKDIGIA